MKATYRVLPEVSKAAIAFAHNNALKVVTQKYDYDKYTVFTGSPQALAQIRAFVQGWLACKDRIVTLICEK